MGEKLLATLSFDVASGRPPLQFILGPEKKVITVGRAPKSDVICTLSGISWNHAEIRLPDDPSCGYLLAKDLSMNGTGLRNHPSDPSQKVPKDSEMQLPNGGVISVPVRKPKSKGKEDQEVFQQSFVLKLEPYSGNELPQKQVAEQVTGNAGNISKKRARATGRVVLKNMETSGGYAAIGQRIDLHWGTLFVWLSMSNMSNIYLHGVFLGLIWLAHRQADQVDRSQEMFEEVCHVKRLSRWQISWQI